MSCHTVGWLRWRGKRSRGLSPSKIALSNFDLDTQVEILSSKKLSYVELIY